MSAVEIPAPLAAEAMATKLRTVQYWLSTGQLPGYRAENGRWYTTIGDIWKFLDALEARGRRVDRNKQHFKEALPELVKRGGDNLERTA